MYNTRCVATTIWFVGHLLPATGALGQSATITRRAADAPIDLHSPIPRRRELPAFVYDSAADRLLVYGGMLLAPDTRTFAWHDDRWSVVSDSGPYQRDDVAAANMGSLGAFVFFGGHSQVRMEQKAFRETWRLEGSHWILADTGGPEARVHEQGAYDPARRRLVVFGGNRGVSPMGQPPQPFATDTWEWDGAGWSQRATEGPPGRMGFVMAYDAVSKMVILHGGVRNSVALTDTWGWDGVRWRQLGTDGPAAIYGAAAPWPGGGVILFGGHRMSAPKSATTWLWNGSTWRSVAESGPAARSLNALATDTRRKRVYMIGGMDDFWYLGSDFKWVEVPLR